MKQIDTRDFIVQSKLRRARKHFNLNCMLIKLFWLFTKYKFIYVLYRQMHTHKRRVQHSMNNNNKRHIKHNKINGFYNCIMCVVVQLGERTSELCGLAYRLYSNVHAHIYTHPSVRPHSCPQYVHHVVFQNLWSSLIILIQK